LVPRQFQTITQHHVFAEGQTRLRTVPVDEVIDGACVSPSRRRRPERIHYSALGVVQVREPQELPRPSLRFGFFAVWGISRTGLRESHVPHERIDTTHAYSRRARLPVLPLPFTKIRQRHISSTSLLNGAKIVAAMVLRWMKKSLTQYVRLSMFIGSTVAVVMVVVLLHWRFGYPIAHFRAMPPGTPWWWYLSVATASGVFAVLLSLTVESARDAVRQRRGPGNGRNGRPRISSRLL
jgi:hypothetical protein